MTNLLRCTVVLFLIILSGASHSQSHDLDQLLGQIIKAYGGEEHLRKLDEQVQEWSVVALMGNRHGTDLRTMRAPDQLKVELTYPGKKETRIVNGETSYVIYGQKSVQAAAQPQRDAMRLQLMRLYSPLVLRDKRDSLTLTADGESHAITLLEHGVRVDYLVNTEFWRIEKVVGSLVVNGSKMQFVTEYSDFTFHDGVLVHQRENKFAGGVNTAVLQLRQVSFDAVLENTDFLPREESANQPEQAQDDII